MEIWYNMREEEAKNLMSKFVDNMMEKTEEESHAILMNVGVKRLAFCARRLNLHGEKQVAADLDRLPGGEERE